MMIVTYFSVTMIIIDQKIEAQDAVDVELVRGERVMPGEGFAEGVDRRGADVAEDDSDRADRQLGQRSLGMTVRRVLRGLGLSRPLCCDAHLNDNLPGPTANPHPWCPRTAIRTTARRTSTGGRAPQMVLQWWRTSPDCPSIGPRKLHERSERMMRVGVPKEIKIHEYRVGMTPASVAELVAAGHEVFVETERRQRHRLPRQRLQEGRRRDPSGRRRPCSRRPT